MKRKTLLSIGVVAAITLTACSTTGEKKENTDKAQNEIHKHETHEHEHEEVTGIAGETLMLNDGERWKVNAEMIPHVQAAEDALKVYVEDGNTDYKTLAENLKMNNNALISSCTMTGESHEQLHHWLHPHLELVTKLEVAENQEDANKAIAEIQASFNKYHNYFN